jgi:DNA polymerase III epsilon subunit-like protein
VSDTLELLAFDIETTGFDADDVVTVVGFRLPLGCQVFCQTDGRTSDDVEATLQGKLDEHVNVALHESEAALLEAVAEFVQMRLRDDDVLLTAFNGETWDGGFDLPFLRTRFAAHGLDWPFVDVPYADVFPVVQKLFNTTINGESRSGLVTAYDVLCDGEFGEIDPFEDSAEAVTAFENGRFTALVAHNVADVLRTAALGELAEQYCSKSDFQVKSLTPTSHG